MNFFESAVSMWQASQDLSEPQTATIFARRLQKYCCIGFKNTLF